MVAHHVKCSALIFNDNPLKEATTMTCLVPRETLEDDSSGPGLYKPGIPVREVDNKHT